MLDKETGKPEPIYLYARINKKRFRMVTDVKVKWSQWHESDGCVRDDKRIKNRHKMNHRLALVKRVFLSVIKEIEDSGEELTVELVKERMLIALGKKESREIKGKMDMWDYFDFFIAEMKRKRGEKASRYFQNARDKLYGFNWKLKWKDIDKKTYLRYVSYLEDKGYSANYMGTLINKIRIMCNRAWEEEIQQATDHKKWKLMGELVESTYLTVDEIEKIYNLKIEKKGHALARDLFIVGCWTGLRSINYLKIDPKIDISQDGEVLKILPAKGGKKAIYIPIHWMVREIFEKYNYEFPKIEYQTLNTYIKDIAADAGFTEMFTYKQTVGGVQKEFAKPRYKMVTTHTARRSFATNMYKQGLPKKVIMDITGHSKEETFMRYIRIEQEESARIIAESELFQRRSQQKERIEVGER